MKIKQSNKILRIKNIIYLQKIKYINLEKETLILIGLLILNFIFQIKMLIKNVEDLIIKKENINY